MVQDSISKTQISEKPSKVFFMFFQSPSGISSILIIHFFINKHLNGNIYNSKPCVAEDILWRKNLVEETFLTGNIFNRKYLVEDTFCSRKLLCQAHGFNGSVNISENCDFRLQFDPFYIILQHFIINTFFVSIYILNEKV